jgi:hypothetical protein
MYYSQNNRGNNKFSPHPHVCLTVCSLVPASEQLGFSLNLVEGVITERCPDTVNFVSLRQGMSYLLKGITNFLNRDLHPSLPKWMTMVYKISTKLGSVSVTVVRLDVVTFTFYFKA